MSSSVGSARARALIFAGIIAGLVPPLLAAPVTGQGARPADRGAPAPSFAIGLEASGLGGLTKGPDRPALGRTAYGGDLSLALGTSTWAWLLLGLDGFKAAPSLPDPSLYLYRGYQGNSIFLQTGPRFSLSGLGLPLLARAQAEVLAGPGLLVAEDTGTTLVSLLPFLRLDARLLSPLGSGWSWSLGLPLLVERHGTVFSYYGGLSLGLRWSTGQGPAPRRGR